MRITKAILAFVTLAIVAVTANSDKLAATASPGAIELYLNATGIQHMFDSLVPLAVALAMQNLTIQLDMNIDGGILYQMDVKYIHLNSVTGVTIKKFAYVPGTNNIEIAIGEIDIDMEMDADLSALYFINFHAAAIQVTNMTLQVFLEFVDTEDGVHWHLQESAKCTFDHVKITLGSGFMNFLLGLMKNVVDDLINNQVVGLIQGMVDDEIVLMNARVDTQESNPYVFNIALDPILGLLGFSSPAELNLTMTTSPVTNGATDDIRLYFAGIFNYPEATEGPIYNLPDYMATITALPPKIPHSLCQQIWLHEAAINSFIFVSGSEFFNLALTQPSFQANVKAAYPEIEAKYGAGAVCTGLISYSVNPNELIHFDMTQGITVTDSVPDNLNLQITCNDGSEGAVDEVVVVLQTNVDAVLDIHMSTIVIYASVKSMVQTQAAKIVNNALGVANLDATAAAQAAFDGAIADFNGVYEAGWSLMNLDPAMAMLGGLIHNITLSPYIT